MKKALTFFVVLILAQWISFADTIVFDPKVTAVEGTKDEIYDRIIVWIAKNFKSSKNVIQFQNKEAGLLTCLAMDAMKTWLGDWPLEFKLTIEIKDEKVRTTFSDISVFDAQGKNITWQIKKEDFKKDIERIEKLFIDGIKTKPANQDW